MSLDLLLVAAMGGALVFTAWMWVPPRRSSGLEPSRPQTGGSRREEQRERIEPFIEPPVDFADLVTIGALEERPAPPRVPLSLRAVPTLGVGSGDRRRSARAEVTAEQRRVILLAAADELGRCGDQDEEQMPPMARNSEGRADDLRAARYGLVRLDGGVRLVGVDDDPRTDTLPPAAEEE